MLETYKRNPNSENYPCSILSIIYIYIYVRRMSVQKSIGAAIAATGGPEIMTESYRLQDHT